ncbi:LysR family transcriptional regulator [Burkholderia alba]|uniref:LysR family transcriptional regulator n=1 Tax=Burkholderia alba TaxID=2683677 RepID=UPI002B05295B|nr:LysR family transcriptional regulator [Burkholderia alba]
MTDSADIRFLLAIRDSGSLVAAARKLGVSPSAVTQRLQQLEKTLGARLVNRTARRLHFTEEGALLCQRGAVLVQQFDALVDDVRVRGSGLVGSLKINAPLGFGRRYIAPAVADFQAANPQVDVALTLSDEPLTEAADRYDLVVHIGELRASNLVGYAIAPNTRIVCAAPSLVRRHGEPASPDDLAKLPCIVLRENLEDASLWHFRKGRTTRSVRVAGALSCNDGDVIRQWACDGLGVILRSEWDVADLLAQRALVRLLPAWKTPDADVIALTHHRTGLPARVRHFLRDLQARFKPLPPWRR